MTSDHTFEQSTSSPQGDSTGWGEVPLLPQDIWHNPQTARFSGPEHITTTLGSDHRMGVPSSSSPIFQFASSSLSSALSPSISPSNPTPLHLQPDGASRYFPGNCRSPNAIEPGDAPMDIDCDNVNQDHRPVDPDRCSISTVVDIPLNFVGTHSPVRFPAPQNSSNGRPSEDAVSIPNNIHLPANPNLEVEVSCVASTLSVSVPPMSSVHGATAVDRHTPGPVIPETLVLEEAPGPLPSPGSEPGVSTKSKRGKPGFNYKLSSSLPVTLE